MKRLAPGILRFLLALAAVLFLAASPASAAGSGPLVDPDWLGQQLETQSVLLLDASMPPQYAVGHIPGAVSAPAFGLVGRDLPASAMEQQLRAWGVSPGRKIVVYDEGGSWMAARLYYDLYYLGVPVADMHLLDGGLHRWKAAGKPVSKVATPAQRAGTFRVMGVRDDARVRLNEFLAATGDPARHAIVDALEPPYYYGGAKFFDRAGHIPNALLWPSSDFFDANTKTFKSPDEIRRMLIHLDIRPEQTVHVYCGGGGAAAVPVFALRFLLGRDKVKLYNESEREWLRDERGLPVWTYAAPPMLRRMAWLDGWASPMLRMFGFAQISVVDLRPTDAYRQGHVPFALNIPAEVFRAHLNEPERLAELLGAAGVDIEHEAVVTADSGLTPDTALAMLLLERAGQKSVSLLADSFDDWALGGLTVAKEPTVVGVRKTLQDLVVPATAYPTNRVRAGLLVRRAAAAEPTTAAFPKVYVAAGKHPPALSPADGSKVIHLPYTNLLNADGSPRAAEELWSLFAKAGLPRFAEVVVVADDPGEAAVSYFVLKLMGFAQVKVEMPA